MQRRTKNTAIIIAWVALFLSILNWRRRDIIAGQSVGDIWDIYRIGLTVIAGAIAAISIFRNSQNVSKALVTPTILLLVYGIVALLSSVLVVASVSFYSMWKAIELNTVIVVCIAILACRNRITIVYRTYTSLVWMLCGMLCLYLIEAMLMPENAFVQSRGLIPIIMQGIKPITQQNGLAFYSAVVALFCVQTLYNNNLKSNKKLLFVILLGISLTELVLAQSRTSFIGFVVAVIVFLFVVNKKHQLIFLTIISVLALVGWGASGMMAEYLMRGQDTTLIETLSGRTIAWSRAWELFKASPIYGYGFVAAARTHILGNLFHGGMSTLHGAFFDVIVGTGLLGLIPWAGAILWVIIRMVRIGRNPVIRRYETLRWKHASMMALLVLILIRSTTSSGLAIHDHTFMLFLCVLMYAVSIRDRILYYIQDYKKPQNMARRDSVMEHKPYFTGMNYAHSSSPQLLSTKGW